MALTIAQIQNAYVAFFNRPADVAGLQYWSSYAGNYADLLNTFAESAEYKDLYAGMNSTQLVNAVYQNLFGRPAEVAGLTYWVGQLDNGALKIGNIADAINKGAQGTDADIISNKVTAATAFTNALDTNAEIVAYASANDTALNAVKTWLNTVTSDAASVTAATGAPLENVLNTVQNNSNENAGQTFTLTVGADTVTGTSGNDTINALNINAASAADTTLSAFDSIDGGAGNDTLNIYTDGENAGLPASAVIKNVETININNSGAGFGAVDASKFVGATAINQIGAASAVTELAATTTAGFKNVTATGLTALDVSAADAETAVKVKLDGVKGAAVTNVVSAAVAGAALNNVTVSGTVAQTTANATAASLALTVTGSTTATSFTLNTAVDTELALTGMVGVTSVNTSAGAGGVTFDGTTQVQTITTGAGKDDITTSFATTATKAATITTGAGDDNIVVTTTGTGLTSVDAGAGDDTIDVTKVAGNKLSILGGDGNDDITLSGAALATSDVIDGGAGTDTIAVAGSATARTDDDFIVLNSLLKNFETLQLTSAEGTDLASGLDVAKLAANYTTIDFAAASFADNVGTQKLVANGNLEAEAAGYDASGAETVYAGSLNVTEKATGTVTATAQSVALTVDASTAAVTGTLAGDVKSATVTLVQGVNDGGTPTDATDDAFFAAAATVTNNATLAELTSLTLSGNGSATVTNVATTKLVTVDASGLNSVDIAGDAAAGLTYTSANALAETIKLGNGIDSVTLNASTYGAVNAKTFDTVQGLNLVLDAADATALDASSDTITVGALNTSKAFTSTQTTLDLALKDAAASTDNNLVFTIASGADAGTYIYADVGATAGSVDSTDVLVKLVGTIDLDALVVALG
ncbi:hypothetical protein AUR61_009565 [Stutzerimonas balearica]|uniref:DUF4214 domain-containing protein n=1 Tax=Stutzerimonas balearica TaxID=74829 RepID=UPI000773F32F|nr:DUF4214 domain-containing protein [Stutzerimonas balearica]OMG65224.1 hypothetical protein AUR61_009565 [Stutzerimonas balearica]